MRNRVIVGITLAGAGLAAYNGLRRWWETWGVNPEEATLSLPGDDIVAEGETLLTRGITVQASPEAIWPWLVQMGYGRAGWYSYDRLDMKGASSDAIRPELQTIAVGDNMPMHPGGGFEVRMVEPGRALVVYLDSVLVEKQQGQQPDALSMTEAPGLAVSGRFMDAASPPDFAVSWAFVLRPDGPNQTRLIERTRGRFGSATGPSRALMPILGFGVFVMTRKQLLGIRDRAERAFASADARPEPTEAVVSREAPAEPALSHNPKAARAETVSAAV